MIVVILMDRYKLYSRSCISMYIMLIHVFRQRFSEKKKNVYIFILTYIQYGNNLYFSSELLNKKSSVSMTLFSWENDHS